MPNELAPARLRELIAAATPGPWLSKGAGSADEIWTDRGMVAELSLYPHGSRVVAANSDLIVYLVNNATALADALEKAKLLEWLLKDMDGPSNVLRTWDGECDFIDAIRAAKEDADAK